jgi:hypothetical protein
VLGEEVLSEEIIDAFPGIGGGLRVRPEGMPSTPFSPGVASSSAELMTMS